MEAFANTLGIMLLIIWLCFSIVFLMTAVQSFIYDRKREAREKEAQKRDLEYHEARMKMVEEK